MSCHRQLSWTDKAWNDDIYWKTQDKKTGKRINNLIIDLKRSTFEGVGKPKPLKETYWDYGRAVPMIKTA
jgi:toxin YoeB